MTSSAPRAAVASKLASWLPALISVFASVFAAQARGDVTPITPAPGPDVVAAAVADVAVAAPTKPPEKVRIAVYLMNLGKLDTSAGTYQMDFYVIARCETACQAIDFEIMNGKVTVEKQDDTPTFRVYRVRGELATNLDLRPYPFDHHTLEIAIEEVGDPERPG